MNMTQIAKTVGGLTTALLLLVSMSTTPLQAAGTPVIGAGGIVNGAHFRAASMPGGDIARGSIFSIFGVEMGPAVAVFSLEFPLNTNVGGVEITVTQGNVTVNAIPLVVSAGQINAIMPSDTPLGVVQVRVICNGVASEPEPVTIVETSIGIFTPTATGTGPGTITDHPEFMQITSTNTAMPGDVVILWVTGVRGIAGPDNVSPIDAGPLQDFKDEIGLQVFVGGVPVAEIFYAGRDALNAGLDIISVRLAADTPLGCAVSVHITANGITSNSVEMATSANGGECSEGSDNPIVTTIEGGRNAAILVAHVKASVDLGLLGALTPVPAAKGIGFPLPGGGNIDAEVDVAVASFAETEGITIGSSIIKGAFTLPYGTCYGFNGATLDDVIDIGTGGDGGAESQPLDAGSELKFTRNSDNAMRTIALDSVAGTGASILGEGGFGLLSSFLGIPVQALFLEAGSYTAQWNGGSDVGAGSVNFTLPSQVTLTNAANLSTINRGNDLRFEWNGGDDDTQVIAVLAANVDVAREDVTGVACVARPSDGGITIDSSMVRTIPASTPPDANGDITSLGFVALAAPQFDGASSVTGTTGLDGGFASSASVEVLTSTYQ